MEVKIMKILECDYLAAALIKGKYEMLNENFITVFELSQFRRFMQKEFNNRNLNIVINNDLDRYNFNIINGVIMLANEDCFNINILSFEILSVLTDSDLIMQFLIEIEKEKLNTLNNFKGDNSKSKVKKLIK